ncbi:MAG: NUDIX domain-containing protein [Gammaproteobacteria bacterium]|nr:NUDIX domain-containing protein [Gammaproteobacteria bacterium]MDH5630261.1 NUDIX domain-containing protein [Gammaproteobacteria bacterium]
MAQDSYTTIVSAVIQQDDQFLLALRKNTRFFPDHWAFPVGRVEPNENDVDAMRRELYEELGIQMLDCDYLTTLYDHNEKIQHTVFLILDWAGEVINQEPLLCEKIDWFELENLPSPLTPATQNIITSLEQD